MRPQLNPILLGVGAPWSYPGSSLDFQFTTGRAAVNRQKASISSLLTTTRASAGYATTSTGSLTLFPANTPRITDLGLLVEQASTNSIRNNSMTGAVAGTPGTLPTNWSVQNLATLTQQIVGIGTDTNNLPYIDLRFSGTPNSTTILVIQFDGGQQIAAVSGQTWTSSNYITLSGGSLTNISSVKLDLTENNAAGSFLNNSTSTITPTSSVARYTLTRTLNQATCAFTISKVDLGISAGSPVDITLRITAPQLEQAAFATSPILTTTVSVTRAADSISLTTAATSLTPTTTGTYLFNMGAVPWGADSQDHSIFAFTQSGTTPGIARYSGGNIQLNDGVGYRTTQTYTNGAAFKYAVAFGGTSVNSSLNGGTISNYASYTGSVSGTGTPFKIGSGSDSGFWNGTFNRITIFPAQLGNSQLQLFTS